MGIYLIVPNKITIEITSFYVTESGKNTKSKFCNKTSKENKYFSDDTFDTYSNNETFVLIRDEFNKYILSDERLAINSKEIDLSEINVSELIDNFKIDYVKYLNAIKKEYGSVEVKFGIVTYCN